MCSQKTGLSELLVDTVLIQEVPVLGLNLILLTTWNSPSSSLGLGFLICSLGKMTLARQSHKTVMRTKWM